MKEVNIYTDGGARGNPGPGGYGAVLLFGKHRKEVCGAFRHTTNNRMELMAAIASLSLLKERCRVVLYSDSKYLVDSMTKGWLEGWKKRGWKKAGNKELLNDDLWPKLDEVSARHEMEWKWVKGHAGNPLNERCDELVHEAIDAGVLEEDVGYSKGG